MPSSHSAAVLDALEAFFGQIQCSAQEAGLEALIETDLSFSQFRSLLILSQAQDPMPIHELAEKLRLSVAATGRAVDRLVKEALVEREEDGLDRRVKLISLAASGQDLVAAFHQSRRTQALSFIEALVPVDRERLLGALLPIIERYPAPLDPSPISA
jgi:DNA-binding MarR family transcriptional regulator